MTSRVAELAAEVSADLQHRLPGQRKTQRDNLAIQRSTKKSPRHQPANLNRSRLSWLTRGMRRIVRLLQFGLPIPPLRAEG
jgi:hypothetical protein